MKCRHIGIIIIVAMMVFALGITSSHADQYDSNVVGYWKMDDMSYDDDFSDGQMGSQWTILGSVTFPPKTVPLVIRV